MRVDYFPHDTSHGKTLYRIEEKYGNEGYAVWFKLLERLGRNDGHYIDFGDDAEVDLVVAHTRVDRGRLVSIIDDMATLNAIDGPLWREHALIWSENFVERLRPVYDKRRVPLPTAPAPTKPIAKMPAAMVAPASLPSRSGSELAFEVRGQQIPRSYWGKVLKASRGDIFEAGRVFFRARKARDVVAYIESGLASGTIWNVTLDEELDLRAAKEWVEERVLARIEGREQCCVNATR